jgi:hypothetical protein
MEGKTMAGKYDNYAPIPAEDLPAKYAGVFKLLDLTFTPPNDFDRVMTITGQSLQLVTDGDNDNRRSRQLVMHAGYQKAIWELREGHLRYCPSQRRLWRRDPDVEDHAGDRWLLNSWHPIKSIEDEYHIGNSANDRNRNYSMSATIMREAKRSQWFQQVERGVRIDPCVWYRQNGRVICVRGDTDMAVTQTFDPKGMSNQAIEQAVSICKWLTVDDKSCANLLRMFATPWLEPFKQLSFVLSGHGGDGKTLLMVNAVQSVLGDRKSYPAFSAARYCEKGFGLASESMNDAMAGMAFAYDDESAEVTEAMLPALRSLSTGATVNARVVGGKYYSMTPTATIVILTNMPFADSSEPSDKRRFVKVEMHRSDGRSFDEYHAIELFIREHPAALYAASCRLWEQGDEPELVNLSPARAISDEMYWIITEILTNEEKYGQLIASRDAYRDEFHKPITGDVMSLLGLANGITKVWGGQKRVVRVQDESRFDVYRQAVKAEEVDDGSPVVPEPPLPLELDSQLPPSLFGFECDYVPANADKSAFNWKKLALDPNVDTSQVPAGAKAYAVVPAPGFMVIDMDMSKTHGDDGWTVLNRSVGRYGSEAFPSTYLVRTPSGGLHAYYRLPEALHGRVKNAVHLKTGEYPDGIPVDLRVERKGYVIGAGSTVNEGDYRVCDLPGDDGIPEASAQICRWLESIGSIENTTPGLSASAPRRQPPSAAGTTGLDIDRVMADEPPVRRRSGRPDMTPVPEGQRNQTLHDWVYGRAVNHPENLRQIEADLYERGHASGLKDNELATIWKSITRQLGDSNA